MKTLLILTTAGCKNCPPVIEYLHGAKHGYHAVFMGNTHPDFTANVEAHNATSAPTVILLSEKAKDGSMTELGRAHDVEGVRALLNEHADG